ncbi:PREDICTED: putative mediator of RNA polymerase II transcription subunit 12 [Nicrophorus vespilloides]|uniref:Mediator of RNA polymerase II transcription subunit 12 n=1 Tax=Nicrophorus vespilloides TaxID=110193 RepID=A0ABM1N411_NICVS|nr:PREDICTED: putative mediator of RNA polymerase II transcription subunit 12 [Nicrophorus vespilloides]
MRLQNSWFGLLLFGAVCLVGIESRRVRVRPQEQEEDSYYADQQEDERVVYISSADQYNGLYGQQAASRSSQDNYIPRQSPTSKPQAQSVRNKEPAKQAPVQTIRNYNKVNDDGSFTFGYEAADGSFKEETRGTDCVVRGKYGYVDPDGNKREFTYVSGNPCDPNAPKEEEDRPESDRQEADSGPANYPTRPIRPIARPVTTAAPKPVTVFQNQYDQEEDEQPEPEQVLRPQPVPQARPRPVYITRPQYEQEEERPVYQQRPRIVSIPSTTPASVIYKQSISPINITPRPTQRAQPATTYRPQLLQVAVTPRPALLYTKQIASAARPTSPTPSSTRGGNGGNIDFDAEFQKFQQENNIVAPTPAVLQKTTKPKAPSPTNQVYSSELVYDPSSGQYNTQLYQSLPQTEGDFTLNHRIQPYVHQPGSQLVNVQQLQSQSPLYRSRPSNNQALYQQQQAELQFQNSAQLYAQQQKVRNQNSQTSPQQFYYIQPSLQQPQGFHQGSQIDAFLRGHNIQF